MSVAELVRERIQGAQTGTFIAVRDLVEELGSRHAVELALTRAADTGQLFPVRRGLYWKGAKTRFGSTRPDSLDAALAVAATAGYTSGVGPTGWSASHVLGLSTQIPAVTRVVVPGRTPAAPSGVEFHQRSPRGRSGLGVLEVALLEVIAQFPHQVEASWDELVHRARSLVADGQVDIDRVLEAGFKQRSLAAQDNAERLAHEFGRSRRNVAA